MRKTNAPAAERSKRTPTGEIHPCSVRVDGACSPIAQPNDIAVVVSGQRACLIERWFRFFCQAASMTAR